MKKIAIFILVTFCCLVGANGQSTNNFLLLIESGENCADFNIDITKKINWYGIYQTDSGDFIRQVNLNFAPLKEMVNLENKSVVGNYVFWTDQGNDSRFIVGTNTNIPEHKVSHFSYSYLNYSQFLFPGQRKTVYTINNMPGRKTLELNAVGCVEDFGYCPNFQNYELRLSDQLDNWKTQNLPKDIPFKGECGMINLKWFGDIDFDGVPDLLFSSSSNSQNQMNLFLSSEAINDDFVKRVASFEIGNCY